MKTICAILFLLMSIAPSSFAAEVGFESMPLGLEIGPGPVKEETGRQLTRVVFSRLKDILGDRPIKALVVNENLNLPTPISEETRTLAGQIPVAVISVEWQNPPYYPAERSKNISRGIYMAAVTGDLKIEFLHADFLGSKNEDESPIEGAQAMSQLLPSLARQFDLQPPKNQNILIALPATHLSTSRTKAITDSRQFPARLIVKHDPLRRATIVTTINGLAKTNSPLGILLKGNFSEGQPRDTEAFSQAVQFTANPFLANFQDLAEPGVRVLEKAKDAEIFRIASRLARNAKDLPEIEGHKILKTGETAEVAAVVADVLLKPYLPPTALSGCGFDPGVAFRMKTEDGTVVAMLCLNCYKIGWTTRNAKGEKVAEGTRDISRETAFRLAAAALEGLPGDEALRRGKDR